MKLISVDTAEPSPNVAGVTRMTITVDFEDGSPPKSVPFGYHPGDPYGITPQVTEWLADNPTPPPPSA